MPHEFQILLLMYTHAHTHTHTHTHAPKPTCSYEHEHTHISVRKRHTWGWRRRHRPRAPRTTSLVVGEECDHGRIENHKSIRCHFAIVLNGLHEPPRCITAIEPCSHEEQEGVRQCKRSRRVSGARIASDAARKLRRVV